MSRGVTPAPLKDVPNGIDIDRFRPDAAVRTEVRAELQIALDAVVVIHVGRVDP